MSGYFEYLNKTEELCSGRSQATTVDQFMDLDHLELALATRSAFYVDYTVKLMAASDAKSKVKENELFAFEVQKMSI